MKKFFFIALSATCVMNVAQAQHATTSSVRAASGASTDNVKTFRQKADEMKASLNANDFTKVQDQWMEVHHQMARRGDELRKSNDIAGSDRRYDLVARLKGLCQNISSNKAPLLTLLSEMEAAY